MKKTFVFTKVFCFYVHSMPAKNNTNPIWNGEFCLIRNCFAPQSEDFSIDFGKGGRSRIEHTTRTHLPKDTEKIALRRVRFILAGIPGMLIFVPKPL